jgi:hypothetical protein
VRIEEVLHRFEAERNIINKIKRKKALLIGCFLRRNCRLKDISEGKIDGGIQVTGRKGIRRKQLLDDLKKMRE